MSDPLLSFVVAAIYNNLGNVELATGNPEDALRYFNLAIPIWKAGGDKTATHLALSYLCVGRVYMFQGKLIEALKMTSQSDTLFMRTVGGDRGFMAKY
jgi:tetratricopeptide (TPR) repeat protein